MKKILSFISILALLSINFIFLNQARAGELCFVVTAYYSPLPNQEFYNRATYEAEIRLNGRGIRGASGKEVFSGMLAAPISKYPYGTKIDINGIGIGEVADIGQAIVEKGNRGYNCDRLDIWVGHGDEGLKRAMAWGKRTVYGKVISPETPTSIKTENFTAPDYVTNTLNKNPNYNPSLNNTVLEKDPFLNTFDLYIGPDSNNERIKRIQKLFREMGYYKGEIDGVYESIKNTIVDYQLKNGVIKSKNDSGAGYFGPKTSNVAKKNYLAIIDLKSKQEEREKQIETQIARLKENINNRVNSHLSSIGNPKYGDIGDNVRLLQRTLKSMGYFHVQDSAIFSDMTKESIIKYQIDKKIISSRNDTGAGIFGPKTKESLTNDLIIALEQMAFKERNLLAYVR